MDKYNDKSYTLIETSLGNRVDEFLDRLLANLRINYSNQSNKKNMSAEQMNIIKNYIITIIDNEIDSVMKTLYEVKDNEFEQNSDSLVSEENSNVINDIKVAINNQIIRKEESLLVKGPDSDQLSELDLALIISKADSTEISKNRSNLKTKKNNSKSAHFGSQILGSLTKLWNSPEMVRKNKPNNNNREKQKNPDENLRASEEKNLEIAMALSSANENEQNLKEIKESNSDRMNQNLYDELISENERLRQMNEKLENELSMRRKEDEKSRQESKETELENYNIQNRIIRTIRRFVKDYVLKPYTKQSIETIKILIDSYNALSVPKRKFNSILENENDLSTNDISIIILELLSILKPHDKELITTIFNYIRPHIEEISRRCSQFEKMYLFDSEKHKIDKTVDYLHPIFLQKFESVEIRGDGNCLWNSISVSLFGDYSFMESLRLITAATFIKHTQYFENYFKEQRNKFGYRHGLTFEQLIDASIELSVWGDEYHILALSLALHRPIISYGSFAEIPNLRRDMSYEELKLEYERENQINHMLYVGDSDSKNKNPICIYYNGVNHYSVILPKRISAQPLVPKTQLFDFVIDREKQQLSKSDLDSKEYKNGYNVNGNHDLIRQKNSEFYTSLLKKHGISGMGITSRPQVSNGKFDSYYRFYDKLERKSDSTVGKSLVKNEIKESRYNRE